MRLEAIQKKRRVLGDTSRISQSKGIFDAFIVTTPDLSICTNLQNLISFSLDIIQDLTKGSGDRSNLQMRLEQCINRIETIHKQAESSFDAEITRLIIEFVEDSRKVLNLLLSFSIEELGTGNADQPLSVLLFAKSSNLQWLAVCLLEELKKPFGRNA